MSNTQRRDLVPVDFDPFEDVMERRIPLTPQQMEMWLESQMGREDLPHSISASFCTYEDRFLPPP